MNDTSAPNFLIEKSYSVIKNQKECKNQMKTIILILSYLAFWALLMPKTLIPIVAFTAIGILGLIIVLISRIKIFAYKILKRDIYIAVIFAVMLGFIFYQKWFKAVTIVALVEKFNLEAPIVVLIMAVVASVCAIYILALMLSIVINKLNVYYKKNTLATTLLVAFITTSFVTGVSQTMISVPIFSMGIIKFFIGSTIVFFFVIFCYVVTGKIKLSIILIETIFMLISTINVYVYQFRARMFEPIDVLTIKTVANVADNYSLLPIPWKIILAWCLWTLVISILLFCGIKKEKKLFAKNRAILIISLLVLVVFLFVCTNNLKTYHWQADGAINNGYILNFISEFKEMYIPEPEDYDVKKIAQLATEYNNDISETNEKKDTPHIIVIMDEAFSDLSVNGDFQTDKQIAPFISSLKENAVSGYALASILGGNTANSEYEFLTGNTMAWLPQNTIPYQQYISLTTYSMVSYLEKNYNYNTVAMHPFYASGWNRSEAYEYFGFDKTYFLEDFPQKQYVRDYISDQEMFEKIVDIYEQQKDEKLFLFAVSMQNHGGYTYIGENYNKSISLLNKDGYPEVEQYLSLIHETDKAVKYLISYFQSLDEKVVIVFYGDHQPNIEQSFYDNLDNQTILKLENQQNKYKVPFFIWTNYDIDEKYVECTSLNYLSSYVYDVADIKKPLYNQFLSEMENTIPAINANGFYSSERKQFVSFEEATNQEKEWLLKYEQLQYNSIFDTKNRNNDFFVTSE